MKKARINIKKKNLKSIWIAKYLQFDKLSIEFRISRATQDIIHKNRVTIDELIHTSTLFRWFKPPRLLWSRNPGISPPCSLLSECWIIVVNPSFIHNNKSTAKINFIFFKKDPNFVGTIALVYVFDPNLRNAAPIWPSAFSTLVRSLKSQKHRSADLLAASAI